MREVPPKKKATAPALPRGRGRVRENCTPELVAAIVNDIERGSYPLTAARANGVARRTWYRWLKEAEDEKAAPDLRHLWHSVEKAKGRLAARYFATINDAALGHEEPVRDSKGNVVFTEVNGKAVPLMVRVPGNWVAAARALESLTPDEFARGPGGRGGQEGDPTEGDRATEFDIVYLTSNRDPKEMREIERKVQERAGRA